MMKNYLSQKNQRTKVNKYYSSWEETFFGVSQNSVLGPILFNIFLSGLFLVLNEIDIASFIIYFVFEIQIQKQNILSLR